MRGHRRRPFERWPVRAATETKGVVKAAKDREAHRHGRHRCRAGRHLAAPDRRAGLSAARPFVVGTLPEVLEKEPNDDPTQAQALTGSAVVNGKLEKPGDVDGFAITLTKGQTLVASMTANRMLGSPMDAHLQVVSPAGFVLDESNDYHGLDPQVVATAPAERAPRADVRVPATPTAASASLGRHLRLSPHPDDGPSPMSVATRRYPISRGAWNGGWNLSEAARSLPMRDEPDRDTVPLWHPDLANTVTVRRAARHCRGARADGPDRPQRSRCRYFQRIDSPGDVDVYEFPAKKGQAATFRLGRRAGFPLTACCGFTDAAGKVLAKADDTGPNRDPELSSPRRRTPHIASGARPARPRGPRYAYRLRVPSRADFDITVANDSFVVAPASRWTWR
jgi:hypothetical protein